MTAFHRRLFVLLFALIVYGAIMVPFTLYMKQKPVEEKLGYVPSADLIRYVSADQREFIAATLLMKVIMYFGGLVDKQGGNVVATPPDYRGMSNIIHSALKLDPYNMDGYYFAQSFLVWNVKQFEIANKLLDYGMIYRTWDWYLPFFAGFNHAYFLKDYKKAAAYYKRAGELSGQELHISLASRYMEESGQTDHAIAFLTVMIKTTRNETAKRTFQVRLKAFQEVRIIEIARDRYKNDKGHLPASISQLLQSGYLTEIPVDPYGGEFYLEQDGKVATTSKFVLKIK